VDTAGPRTGDGTTVSAAAASVVGAIRDGSLAAGDALTDEVMLLDHGIRPVLLDRVIDHLVGLGVVRMGRNRVAVVRGPDPAAWTDTIRLSLALLEGAVRTSIPALREPDRIELEALLTRVEELGELHDPETGTALRAVSRFWLERTPNDQIRRQWTSTLDRAQALAPRELPFRDWGTAVYARTLRRAVVDGDAELGCEAVHELARLLDRQVVEAAAAWSVPPGEDAVPAGLPADDDAFWTVLAGLRAHVWPSGTTIGLPELVERTGAPPTAVVAALDRIEWIGLVRFSGDRAVVVRDATIDEHADSMELYAVVYEACVRWSLPRLDDAAREALHGLVAIARRRGATRDLGYAEATINVARFFAEHVPAPILRSLMLRLITRVVFHLNPSPPYRQWDTEDFWTPLLVAVDTGDVELACEATHALYRHIERHIADVRATWVRDEG
jgi:DNA-binding GntR family transcriptional regulator